MEKSIKVSVDCGTHGSTQLVSHDVGNIAKAVLENIDETVTEIAIKKKPAQDTPDGTL